MQVRSAIAKVIRACLDDERTLVQRSKLVDAERSELLIRMADERRRFAEELEQFNGQGSRESWGTVARELESNLWARVVGRNTGDAVAACRRSQRRTEARYDQVLKLVLPTEVRAALMIQYKHVRAARNELTKVEY
jgi:uncharacterized protein (TIGR02284 family)